MLNFHIQERMVLKIFNFIERGIDRISEISGKMISWVNLLLVLLICVDVFLRYFFNISKNWVLELEWHFFALIFIIGAAYTLKEDKHVRVDLFYAKYAPKKKAIINLIGSLFFLIPWCLMIIFTAFDYAMNSYSFKEGSPNPGGLPALYIIKFAIVVGFVLLLLQAFSISIKSVKILLGIQKAI